MNNLDDRKSITLLVALQDIRDMAWQQAIKYRFDPVVGRAHEEYLKALNAALAVANG